MSDLAGLQGQIMRIFSEKLYINVAGSDTDLIDGGVLDSSVFVELLFHLEQDFGLEVALEHLEIDNFRSVRRIAESVAGQTSLSSVKAS